MTSWSVTSASFLLWWLMRQSCQNKVGSNRLAHYWLTQQWRYDLLPKIQAFIDNLGD